MNYNIFCSKTPGPELGAAPGECWVYSTKKLYKAGIILHLVTIIPAGFLALFQFVPVIRHKVILFHRINGYLVILLVLASNVGAMMIARIAFGGTLSTQVSLGILAVMIT